MDRAQVGELFYITHISNVPGILRSGILSHNRVAKVSHVKVDLDTVQEIRAGIRVSTARMLHDHANLYVCGRNAMMFHVVHHNRIDDVCLLRVSPEVLDLPEVVVTDGNAARWETRFDDANLGLAGLNFSRVHARYWTHPGEPLLESEHRRVKQAEVLVPDFVDPGMILGAYAGTPAAKAAITTSVPRLDVVIARYPFFDGNGWT